MRRLLRVGGFYEHVGHVTERLSLAGNALALLAMNTIGYGKRLVMRVVILQTVCAGAVSLVFGMMRGSAAAVAALIGGLIVAIGSGVFGWRLFAPGIAPASVLHRALFAAESLKWVWYVFAIWVALTRLGALPLPLLTGLICAQFAYWLGLVGMKRGN